MRAIGISSADLKGQKLSEHGCPVGTLVKLVFFDPGNEALDTAKLECGRLYVGIKDDLTFDEPYDGEGRLAATLQGLSDEDASAVAARIWRLYYDLRDRVKQSERD